MAIKKSVMTKALKAIATEGLTLQAAAKRFNVSTGTITNWKRNSGLKDRARAAVRNVTNDAVPAFFTAIENDRNLSTKARFNLLKTYFTMN